MNAALGYRFATAGLKHDVSLTLDNISDTRYYNYLAHQRGYTVWETGFAAALRTTALNSDMPQRRVGHTRRGVQDRKSVILSRCALFLVSLCLHAGIAGVLFLFSGNGHEDAERVYHVTLTQPAFSQT